MLERVIKMCISVFSTIDANRSMNDMMEVMIRRCRESQPRKGLEHIFTSPSSYSFVVNHGSFLAFIMCDNIKNQLVNRKNLKSLRFFPPFDFSVSLRDCRT